jgi:hypothetical protein
MNTFVEPVYYLDLDHSLNRSTRESAKLGQPIAVLVKAEKLGPSIEASRIRVGSEFRVVVHTPDGEQDFTWTWEFLRDALRTYRN